MAAGNNHALLIRIEQLVGPRKFRKLCEELAGEKVRIPRRRSMFAIRVLIVESLSKIPRARLQRSKGRRLAITRGICKQFDIRSAGGKEYVRQVVQRFFAG